MNAIALNISNIPVRQDSEGRYSLNDLHKASGNLAKHKPSEYLRNQQAKDLITEIELEAGIPAIKIIKGRGLTGTYAVKELVYAYAMWISPAFTLKVIHAYDSLVSVQYGLKQLPEPPTITKAEAGLLFNTVNSIAGDDNKMRSAIWKRFQNHFKVNSYKFLPAEKFDEASQYLEQKRIEYRNGLTMLYVSDKELQTLISEGVKAKEGEILEKPKENTVTVSLGNAMGLMSIVFDGATADENSKYLVIVCDKYVSVNKMSSDCLVMTEQEAAVHLSKNNYIVIQKDEFSIEHLVMQRIPARFLPVLIETAGARLKTIG